MKSKPFTTQLHTSACSDWLIFYEKEMVGSQRWFRLTSQSVKFRLFRVKTVSLCYKSNGQCLAYVHPIRDTLGQLRDHLGSQRCSRASLTLPSCSPNHPSVSRIGWTHARHCQFLKETSNILFSITVRPTILHTMTINEQMKLKPQKLLISCAAFKSDIPSYTL